MRAAVSGLAFAAVLTVSSFAFAQIDMNWLPNGGVCPDGLNVINAAPGQLRVRGTNGADCIIGPDTPGATIFARGGDDYIIIGAAGAQVRAGSGDDVVIGGPGDDDVRAGRGDDIVFGMGGDDRLRGQSGADQLFGGPGTDELRGGSGDDVAFGQAGDDEIRGGRGGDVLDGGDGMDKLWGRRGNDILIGGAGGDELRGNQNNDYLVGGDELNILHGGSGLDACDFDRCKGDTNSPGDAPLALLVSRRNNRYAPMALSGNILHGNIFAFIQAEGVDKVDFYLDDPDMAGNPILSDERAPFDFCGTNDRNGTAWPFPTVRFTPNGMHTVTARVTLANGDTVIVNSSFLVDN